VSQGEIRMATRYPYGRDALDRLLCDTAATPNTRWRYLWKGHRGMPLFELGQDDGRKWIYFLLAGEDAWETSGQWTTDAMIRTLCADRVLAGRLASQAVVRIVPWSPRTARRSRQRLHGARWPWDLRRSHVGEPDPPPEIALLRARSRRRSAPGASAS